MTNLRIGTRMALGFGVVVGLAVVLGIYSLARQSAVREFTEEMNDRDLRMLNDLRKVAATHEGMRALRHRSMSSHMARAANLPAEDPTGAEQEWRRSKEATLAVFQNIEASAAEYQRTALSPARAEQWRAIGAAARESREMLASMGREAEEVFSLLNRGQLRDALARTPDLSRLRNQVDLRIANAERLIEQQVETGRAEVARSYDEARASILIALLAAVGLGVICSTYIQRSITTPLRTFMLFIERVGKGDLTQKSPAGRRDEIGDLARSLNDMVAGLREVAGQTRSAAENVGAATAEILASTQQQAASTAEQAAAVQQTNATMTEVSQAGAQISERAKQVAAAAEATSASSTAGLQAVRNTATNMQAIRDQAEAVAENVVSLSERTQAIGEIIATVNDISEQSHLLALNAAIEAAAAGEHGRSFTVVASEMKNLADQSKQATVQVRSILGEIQRGINSSVMLTEEAVKRVESGRQQADVADTTIRQLSDNIQQSVQAFQQIVAGSSQQQIGFDQVTQALKNISLATEQTAASTRQSEKAAANLNALAHQLRRTVETYRT